MARIFPYHLSHISESVSSPCFGTGRFLKSLFLLAVPFGLIPRFLYSFVLDSMVEMRFQFNQSKGILHQCNVSSYQYSFKDVCWIFTFDSKVKVDIGPELQFLLTLLSCSSGTMDSLP